VLHAWLRQRVEAGQWSFKATDDGLADLRQRIGMSRQWTYKVLKELVDAGWLTHHNGTYTITTHGDTEPGSEPGDAAA
jgi:DNA-binding GntR family transcriptional regulator